MTVDFDGLESAFLYGPVPDCASCNSDTFLELKRQCASTEASATWPALMRRWIQECPLIVDDELPPGIFRLVVYADD